MIRWDNSDYLAHYGTKGHSGRYPPGSGKNPKTGIKASISNRIKRKKRYIGNAIANRKDYNQKSKQNAKSFNKDRLSIKKEYKQSLKNDKPKSLRDRLKRRNEYGDKFKDSIADHAINEYLLKKELRTKKLKNIEEYNGGTDGLHHKLSKKILNYPIEEVHINTYGILARSFRVKQKDKQRYDIDEIHNFTDTDANGFTTTTTWYEPIRKNYKRRR